MEHEEATCISCGTGLGEGAAFCSVCGAAQADAAATESSADTESQSSPDAATGADSTRRPAGVPIPAVVVGVVLILLVVVGAVGLTQKQSADRQAAEAAAAAARATVEKDKTIANAALASVEKCESAVTTGVSLSDLQDLADTARGDMLVFARTDTAERMPRFTSNLEDAAQAYSDSCNAWMVSNKAAMKKYEVAVDKWVDGKGRRPKLESYKDDTGYQAAWADAGASLDAARAAFATEARTQ